MSKFYLLTRTHGHGIVYYGDRHWPSMCYWQVPIFDYDMT